MAITDQETDHLKSCDNCVIIVASRRLGASRSSGEILGIVFGAFLAVALVAFIFGFWRAWLKKRKNEKRFKREAPEKVEVVEEKTETERLAAPDVDDLAAEIPTPSDVELGPHALENKLSFKLVPSAHNEATPIRVEKDLVESSTNSEVLSTELQLSSEIRSPSHDSPLNDLDFQSFEHMDSLLLSPASRGMYAAHYDYYLKKSLEKQTKTYKNVKKQTQETTYSTVHHYNRPSAALTGQENANARYTQNTGPKTNRGRNAYAFVTTSTEKGDIDISAVKIPPSKGAATVMPNNQKRELLSCIAEPGAGVYC